jgi:diguanylate cyclase (GGDEF)-like protein
MNGSIAFVLCEHYRREAQAVLEMEGFTEAVVATFPARCNHPPLGLEELNELLYALGDQDEVHLLGASCCLASIPDPPAESPHVIHRLPQCFSMIADQEVIHQGIREGGYLVCPGWLSDWPVCLERMGLDRQSAREMFRETTSRIILLDTGIDPLSGAYLKDFADFVERPYQAIPVGLSFLRLQFTRIILARRLEREQQEAAETVRDLQKQSANHAMAVDLLSQLAQTTEEDQAVEAMLDVFMMLFAAGTVSYLSFADGKPEKLYLRPEAAGPGERAAIRARLAGIEPQSGWSESDDGFLLRLRHRGETQGIVSVDRIAFPQYREHYLNLALSIAPVCALPIDNARKYQKLQQTETQLREVNEELLRMAATDGLTGIANRRAFDDYLEREWKRMIREKSPLSLILCDIDFFKNYNDRYGHIQGDACLKAVAQALLGCLVRPGDFPARYGGEEFVLVLPDTPLAGALHVAEQIQAAIRKLALPHETSAVSPFVTLSLGVAQADPLPGAEIDDLLAKADEALYGAKRQGRNRIVAADRTGAAEA